MGILDKIKGERENIKVNRAGNTRAYKLKPGKTVVSFLPLHSDLTLAASEQNVFRKFGMHYIKNPKDDFVVAVGDKSLCFEGEQCVVRDGLVDMIRYANRVGDADLAEAAKKSLARPGYLFNVMVHQGPDGKKEDDPQLVQFSEALGDQFFSILEEYLEGGGDDLTRWNDRLMFVIEREGTSMTDTRYKIYPAAKRISVDQSVMTKAVNLDEYVTAQFQDSVQKALTYIAQATGKTISGTAMAAALTGTPAGTPALAAPASAAADEDLLAGTTAPATAAAAERTAAAPALERAVAVDAEFEDVTDLSAPAATPTAPAATASADDLLAEIDGLAA